MASLTALLSKWALIRQISERTEGTVLDAMSEKTCSMACADRRRASGALGAFISRFGWMAVGKVSGSGPESVFAAERCEPQSLIAVMLPNDLSLKGESRYVPGWRRKILRTRRGSRLEHGDKIFV